MRYRRGVILPNSLNSIMHGKGQAAGFAARAQARSLMFDIRPLKASFCVQTVARNCSLKGF